STVRTLPPPRSTLFPYTTLFRSVVEHDEAAVTDHRAERRERLVVERGIELRRMNVRAERAAGLNRANRPAAGRAAAEVLEQLPRSEEHTSELQSRENLVCRLLLE